MAPPVAMGSTQLLVASTYAGRIYVDVDDGVVRVLPRRVEGEPTFVNSSLEARAIRHL
jgi:hypothetical protein